MSKPEIMATRSTFDGKTVQLWTDGSVTFGQLCTYVRGSGVATSPEGIRANVAACWLLAGEVAIYDADELPKAVKAARRAVRTMPELPLTYFREVMAGRKAVACNSPRGGVVVFK